MISVVTPVFNGARYILDTIQSVIDQTYTDWEMVIADDGSTDGSLDISSSLDDTRIRRIHCDRNTGVAAALNRAIRASRGSAIAILSADDLLTPSSLKVRFDALQAADLICGQVVEIGPETALKQALETKGPVLTPTRFFYGPTNLIRRTVFERYGLFDEILPQRTDREMWVRLFGKNRSRTDRATFACLSTVVGYYRVRPDSNQQQVKLMSNEKRAEIERAYRLAVERRVNDLSDVQLLEVTT